MLQRGSGAIVNISSVQAFTPLARRVAYAASKAGVIGVTKALAVEWAPAVRVNAVAPGYVATQMVEELVQAGRVNAEAIAAMRNVCLRFMQFLPKFYSRGVALKQARMKALSNSGWPASIALLAAASRAVPSASAAASVFPACLAECCM